MSSTTAFTNALRKLNALPISTALRYNTIAKKLGLTPVGKNGRVLKPVSGILFSK